MGRSGADAGVGPRADGGRIMDGTLRRFGSYIDVLSGPAWLMAEGGRMLAANLAFRECTGITDPGARAWAPAQIVAPEDVAAVGAACDSLLSRAADGLALTISFLRPDGRTQTLGCHLTAVTGEEGVVAVFAQGSPVLPRAGRAAGLPSDPGQADGRRASGFRTAQDARGSRSEAHQALADALEEVEILRITNATGKVVAWQRVPDTGESWFGDNIGELLGLPADTVMTSPEFRTMIHPDDLPAVVEAHLAIEQGRTEIYRIDFRVRRADGSWCAVASRGRRVDRSSSGLPYMICGSFVDITERNETEERLARALAEAEAALEAAQMREELLKITSLRGGIGHFTVVPGSDEGWATDATYRLLGYEPRAFPSTDAGWRSLIHPDDLPGAVAAMEALQQRLAPTYEHDHRLRHGDGSYHWYRAAASWIERSDTVHRPLLAGALIGIDQMKRDEAKLAEAADVARLARERLNTLADNAPGALFEHRETASGEVDLPYFSARLPDLLGVPREVLEADGGAGTRNIHPADLVDLAERMRHSRETMTALDMHYRLTHPEKGLRWMMLSSVPLAQPDGAVIWCGNVFDMTDQLETERRAGEAAAALRQAHERLSSVAEIAPVGLYEIRRYGPGNIRITYTSAHFEQLLGYSREEIQALQAGILQRLHREDAARYARSIDDSSRSLSPRYNRVRILHPARGLLWVTDTAIPRLGSDGAVVWTGALLDVTADVEREAELRRAHRLAEEVRAENERQALHDGLTGLPNRRFFDQMLARRIESARDGGPADCALVRIDLDHFKNVNDTLGHEAGDQVLIRVADVLRGSLRMSDFASRIGGDEFSVLLAPGTKRAAVEEIIGRIQSKLAQPVLYDGRQCRFGASFGVAETDDITSVAAELQLFADAALYRAKDGGRNRMEFFTPELHRGLLNDRSVAAELHEALEGDQFVPFFQPQVSSFDSSLVGIEVLLRWRHPTRGVLAPDAFIRVAEQLRIMPEIDRLMMEKSRAALAGWRHAGLCIPKISFNVSSGRIRDADVVALAQEMAEGDTRVTFELLESILVEEESETFRHHLEIIRSAGIEIEIDDFGSGHASIIGLMEIAPSALKIDRRIVAPVAHDERARNLVRAIVEIAENLGIATIAEGIETEEQAAVIRRIGCNTMQGFLFAHPLCEEDLLRYAHPAHRCA
ncbi:sensor domain-containing protein [Rhodobacter sp. NSM]|uniref:sensor domain-containing protein n=1 Tax=Rhodobacter sp. NSM TaxID=3457501 RepID=UPI003FD20C40